LLRDLVAKVPPEEFMVTFIADQLTPLPSILKLNLFRED